ncbi:MAG: hypothetical protein ABW075_12930 [Aeromicrobium sp.]
MTLRTAARWLLGTMLAVAGLSHLTFAREEFRAQVPTWFPGNEDVVVVASGVVEVLLGAALILFPRQRVLVGWIVATFFVAVFPGNISQLVTHTDAFGLESDRARWLRLPFQPFLIAWSLWSTEAWKRRAELKA